MEKDRNTSMSQRLYVGNLPYSLGEASLEQIFSQTGEVESVKIVTDKFDGRSKGYGFVEMASEDDAEKAIAALNGHEIDGRNLRVDKANKRVSRKGWGGPRAFRGGGRF